MPSTPRITSDLSAAVPLVPQRLQPAATGERPFAALLHDAMPKTMPHKTGLSKSATGGQPSASPAADSASDAQVSATEDDQSVGASSKPAAPPDASLTAGTEATVTAAASTATALDLAVRDDAMPPPTAKTAAASEKDDNCAATLNVNQAQPQAQPSVSQPVAALLGATGADGAVSGAPNKIDLPALTLDKSGVPSLAGQNTAVLGMKDAAAEKQTPSASHSPSAVDASAPDKPDTGSTGTAEAPSSNANAQQSQSQPPTQADDTGAGPAASATPALGSANRAAPPGNAATAAATSAAGQSSAPAATGALNAGTLPNFGFVAANANTAAAAPAATADAAVPLAGLAVAITARAQAGAKRFDIRLDPPELGRIDVRLAVDGNGQVTSHVTVDRADTLQLLQNQQPQLERALQQAGLQTADNGLQFTLRDQSFAGQNGTSGGQQHTAQLVIPDAELAPVDTAQIYSRLSLGSGLDIRV